MTFDLHLEGPPSRWVAAGGAPAAVLREYDPAPGMPSYESESGTLVVFDAVIAKHTPPTWKEFGGFMGVIGDDYEFLPRSYGHAIVRDFFGGGDGLCPLYDDPDAMWSWRPLLYRLAADGLRRFGSQEELSWRHGIVSAIHDMNVEDGPRMMDEYDSAPARAREALLEFLDWKQQLDLELWGHFFERGEVNRLYQIRPGDGFAIVDEVTLETHVSLCLHPETYLPHDDVALATAMLIRQGIEGEKDLLEAARARWVGGRGKAEATRDEVAAFELERSMA